jgi:hypothetical protein
MFSDSGLMYLPLVIIDVSSLQSDRRYPVGVDETEAVAPRVSRRSRFVTAARANIVRLIPGATRLPFEPASR